ncbi:hypothetical protein HOD20_05335 [archaeon]|nr:hypothetical protein [archaeon]
MTSIKEYCRNMSLLLDEIETYNRLKNKLQNDINILDKQYQRGDLEYNEYIKIKNNILGNNSKNLVFGFYDKHINSIVNNLGSINTKLLKDIYTENIDVNIIEEDVYEKISRQTTGIKLPSLKGDFSSINKNLSKKLKFNRHKNNKSNVENQKGKNNRSNISNVEFELRKEEFKKNLATKTKRIKSSDFEKSLHRKGIFKIQGPTSYEKKDHSKLKNLPFEIEEKEGIRIDEVESDFEKRSNEFNNDNFSDSNKIKNVDEKEAMSIDTKSEFEVRSREFKKNLSGRNKIESKIKKENVTNTVESEFDIRSREFKKNLADHKKITDSYHNNKLRNEIINKKSNSKPVKLIPKLNKRDKEDYIFKDAKPAQNLKTVPKPHEKENLYIPPVKKLKFPKNIIYAFQAKEKPLADKFSKHEEGVKMGGIVNSEALKFFMTGKRNEKSSSVVSASTNFVPSIFSLQDKKIDESYSSTVSKSEVMNPYLLEKQVKALKNLITKKGPKIYKPSSVGYFANITVRRISIHFIEKYPALFKKLYLAIRYANIKVLSNTYINIMFLISISALILSIPILTVLFSLQGNSIFLMIIKTMFFSSISTLMTFTALYYYPFSLIKKRKASINTNLPFAIDHMSSVISSGVSPAVMFKLISASKEYGEVSIEMEKIYNYIDVFGYDLLTAMRAVSYTTPSADLKEFFEGFISNVETGGELKNYLSQKSSEALMNYRLKRQKYVESLATYSDIYTGVLIAAPLFFVTTFSLVSVMGGQIGGLDISTVITVGTYLVIPLLM